MKLKHGVAVVTAVAALAIGAAPASAGQPEFRCWRGGEIVVPLVAPGSEGWQDAVEKCVTLGDGPAHPAPVFED
jgi:hypothetical protein